MRQDREGSFATFFAVVKHRDGELRMSKDIGVFFIDTGAYLWDVAALLVSLIIHPDTDVADHFPILGALCAELGEAYFR